MKKLAIVLLLVAAGLGVALLYRHNEAVKQQKQDENHIVTLSNRVVETQVKLQD